MIPAKGRTPHGRANSGTWILDGLRPYQFGQAYAICELSLIHICVAHHVTAHEFVPAVNTDMVLVTEIRAFMLLRPARVLVLLAVLGRLGFPIFRRFAFLDRLVVLARIVLLGCRHDRRVDDLPAPRCV